MENPVEDHQKNNSRSGFGSFAFKRFIIAVILIVMAVWALSVGPDMVGPPDAAGPPHAAAPDQPAAEPQKASVPASDPLAPADPGAGDHSVAQDPVHPATQRPAHEPASGHDVANSPAVASDAGNQAPSQQQASVGAIHDQAPLQQQAAVGAVQEQGSHQPASKPPPQDGHKSADAHAGEDKAQSPAPSNEQPHAQQETGARTHDPASSDTAAHGEQRPAGVAFVEAVMKPLNYELNEHFWGWRPNDIVNLTDNVNNFQKGVLEVTRRSVVLLSERISRTGTTAAFNKHLENAMNWLMVKPDRYWFPSPESKYKESLEELEKYKQGLYNGKASFHTRSDNIIPLLASYEDLLGSSDENLVKQKEKDGSDVSFFDADDKFFYAKGVASTMAVILEAVHHDFAHTIKTRHGEELLHHAIESCRQAAALDPLIITDGDLDGILANHRAHMAAPISHARFYIGQLIKTLST